MNQDIINAARDLALKFHGDQMYGDQPVRAHLADVAQRMVQILRLPSMQFYSRTVAESAGWLHDSLEDTGLTYAAIIAACGEPTANLVYCVTDAPGINRHARKAATYPKTRAGGPLAIGLKLADRIGNVIKGLKTEDVAMQRMYTKEHQDFSAALYNTADGLDTVWAELDGLIKQGRK